MSIVIACIELFLPGGSGVPAAPTLPDLCLCDAPLHETSTFAALDKFRLLNACDSFLEMNLRPPASLLDGFGRSWE